MEQGTRNLAAASRITELQIVPASEALGRAFFDDPLLMYLMPDGDARRRLAPQFFQRLVRAGHLFGETYTTPEASGVAYWMRPGGALSKEQAERAGMDEIPAIVGEDAFAGFSTVVAFLKEFRMRDAPEGHWYLELLGVDTALQGQGAGSALMQPVLEQADAEGVPCYLETANEKNVAFYQKQGFDVIVDTVDPTSGLRLWTFRREPGR